MQPERVLSRFLASKQTVPLERALKPGVWNIVYTPFNAGVKAHWEVFNPDGKQVLREIHWGGFSSFQGMALNFVDEHPDLGIGGRVWVIQGDLEPYPNSDGFVPTYEDGFWIDRPLMLEVTRVGDMFEVTGPYHSSFTKKVQQLGGDVNRGRSAEMPKGFLVYEIPANAEPQLMRALSTFYGRRTSGPVNPRKLY